MTDWVEKPHLGIHMDFHTPEFLDEAIVNFNPDRWVELLQEAHVQYVNIFAKCLYGELSHFC